MTFIVQRPPIRAIQFEEAGEALDRLIAAAQSDTGGARRVASFLLSWWDGDDGQWAMIDIANVDAEIGEDILIIIAYLAQTGVCYADAWGREKEMGELIDKWNWKGRGGA
ncbi:DUF7673 family protein [Sphingomonas beigongshangi]|uniref:DUF7673 family protein n=1 Tax=Sphingomonas beigongshangi TaxID=2782540 RepID=UPI00193BD983|nr:hypothetical protein [Sphingomonas beigongshangi]